MSIYLFSDTSQFNRISKVALFGTTAFVLSVLTVAPSFAQEVVFKECSSCKGEGLASSLTATAGGESIGGQIYTTGLAADEMDAGLQEKAESYAIASGGVADYRETEGSSLLDLLKKDADADSQRKVYIPENSNPVAKKKTVQKSEVPAFKEASLNITPEEERYLRDGSSYVAGRAPAAQITASLVFDDYSQYADGVKVAPIATYKAALKKAEANSAESAKVQKKDVVKTALVVAEPEASVDAIFSDNSVAGNSIPAESEPKDMFVSAPIPTPAFADSLAVTGSSSFNDNAKAVGSDVAAGELSPLEALLMSDDSSKVASNNNISAAGSSIPAFSNSLNMNAALNVEPKSEQKKEENLLVPMGGIGYAFGNTYKKAGDDDVVVGGAVSWAASGQSDLGYGTDYAAYGSAHPTSRTTYAVGNDTSGAAGAIRVTPIPADEVPNASDKGIIDRLKDWFTLPDSGTQAAARPAAKKADKVQKSATAADTVDEILARYANRNKARNDGMMIASAYPTGIAVVFEENSANTSASTVKRLNEFAKSAADTKNSLIKIQLSKVNLSLQARRFALIKSILAGNGISMDRVRPSVDGSDPDTIVLMVETAAHAVGAYEKIEAMGE